MRRVISMRVILFAFNLSLRKSIVALGTVSAGRLRESSQIQVPTPADTRHAKTMVILKFMPRFLFTSPQRKQGRAISCLRCGLVKLTHPPHEPDVHAEADEHERQAEACAPFPQRLDFRVELDARVFPTIIGLARQEVLTPEQPVRDIDEQF